MITRMEVSNYRSLGDDVRLDLGRFTVLVGPNGSGKSNVADVLRFVSEAIRQGLDAAITSRHGITAVRRWSSGRPFNLRICLRVSEERFTGGYEFELTGDRSEDYRVKLEHAWLDPADNVLGPRHEFRVEAGEWHGPSDLRPEIAKGNLALPAVAGDERFRPLAESLREIEVYAIFPDALRRPQKHDPAQPMRRHGENWTSALRSLDAEAKAELGAALEKLTGDILDVQVIPVAGFLAAMFSHRPQEHDGRPSRPRKKWFDAAQESDGTLRFAGILTALLQQPVPRLIGVEEPELTVHVGAIRLLHDFLIEAAGKSQLLITTHSPELLDLVETDQVRVVLRNDGVTTVSALHASQREVVRQRLMSLGEVARSEGLQPADEREDIAERA